jgi:O-antigen ligase
MIYVYYFYLVLAPMENVQAVLPKGPTGINYQNLMLAIMVGALIWQRVGRGRTAIIPSALNLPMLAYAAVTYLGLVVADWRYDQAASAFSIGSDAVKGFIGFVNGLCFFWFAAAFLNTRRKIHYAVLAMGLIGVYIFRHFFLELGGERAIAYSHDMRKNGVFVWLNVNALAAFFLYGCIFFFNYSSLPARLWERVLFRFVSAGYAYGVMYSFSRGSWVALIVAMLIMTVLRYRWAVLVIALAVGTADLWVPDSVHQRWSSTVNEEGVLEDSAQRRVNYNELALAGFRESPVIGHGIGTFRMVNPTGQDPHNLYLGLLYECGAVGLSVVLVIWVLILRMAYLLWRGGREHYDRQFGFALLMASVALAITNYFGDRFTHVSMIAHYWTLVGCAYRLYADMKGYLPLEEEAEAEHEVGEYELAPAE